MSSVRADLAECRRQLNAGSKSFAAAARVLPRRVRDPATALYAFCRWADDEIDGHEPERGIERVRAALERIYGGASGVGPIERALAAAVRAFELPRPIFDWLVEGFQWDAAGRRYADLEELRAYGVRVAGTVGLAMCLLMGRRDPAALARAMDLGVAMQLTNIARDVGEDAWRGRLYLPQQLLDAAGHDGDALHRKRAAQRVVAEVLAEADRCYRRADLGIPLLPLDCRPSIRAARLIYAEIGMEIARAGYDSISRRAVVPARRKAVLLIRALDGLVLQRSHTQPGPLEEGRALIEAVTQGAAAASSMRAWQ